MKKLLSLTLTLFLLTPVAEAARGPIPTGGFKNCTAAKAAGYWNIKRGEPAYHPKLDRDKDGIACEK